ncbi:hypothetical protein PENSPDRAFT_684239 [Peniophora sp. CONT]|nr:hypothetical protein PENSPDRAFT_684239 [Peniophora sp. CONT]
MAEASSSHPSSAFKAEEKTIPRLDLLDDEGELSEKAVSSLEHIFAKYCTPAPTNEADATSSGTVLLQPPEGAVLTDDALDTWALDTNGALLSDGEKAELEMLDVDDDGRLTCKGFIQLYQLQTENDDDETWKDLTKHGFDGQLQLKKVDPKK